MYLDKIYLFRTGVSLEISTTALRTLVEGAMAGQRISELARIRCPADLHSYLSVVVHAGAEGLVKRRHAWAGRIKADLLAGKPVSYGSFSNLFWRNLDEEDPDGDEWYRLIAGERFHSQLRSLLDMLRSAERRLNQREACAA
ncbi:MAG: hypothetical protein Q7S69_06350 [Nitrosomonadaceae bacterium]|nr:hypothetical protein [Nitrosomonadaceae bacterium]